MLEVGQKLFFVGSLSYNRRREYEVEVYKVGRKWAYIDHEGRRDRTYRVDIKTLEVDGGEYASPGQCYISKEAYETKRDRDRAWSALRLAVYEAGSVGGALAMPDASKDDIIAAAKLLGLEDELQRRLDAANRGR